MYSFVLKLAVDVNRPVLLVLTKSTLGFNNDSVDDVIAKFDPDKFSEIIESTLFLFKFFHISFSKKTLPNLRGFQIFS